MTVRLDLGGAPATTSGCAGFATRLTDRGAYEGIVCSSGAWVLRRVDGAQAVRTVLASGITAPSHSYTLSMAADGVTESLAVNGMPVASVTDATFASGDLELAVVNLTADPETVAFSDFTYAPPSRTASTTPTRSGKCQPSAYCAPVPGPSCDLGGAGWSNLAASTATDACTPAGLQYTVAAHATALVAFFPPNGTTASTFSVAVTVTPSAVPNSLVAIDTVSSAEAGDAFAYVIFTPTAGKAEWGVVRYSGSSSKVLGVGELSAGAQATDTLTVTTHGATRVLSVNGRQVLAFSDAQFPTTEGILLGAYNAKGMAPATTTFSDFVYQPMP